MLSGVGVASLPPVSRRQMLPTLLAPGAANGLPSVITMRTAAGICRAASRAMMPPRLQPTRLTGRFVAARRREICARIAGISASDGRTLRPRLSRGHHSRARTGSCGWQPSNGHRLQAPGGRSRHDGAPGRQRQKRRRRCQGCNIEQTAPLQCEEGHRSGLTSRSLPVMAGSAVLKPVGSQTVFGDCVGKNRNEPGGEIVTHSIYNL